MGLRVLLVGLVACLGLDLPSGEELLGWRRSGRDWVAARMAELSTLRVNAELALLGAPADDSAEPAPTTLESETVSGRVDLAFEAVVEEMASSFSADLASMSSKPSMEAPIAAIDPETEPVPVSEVDEDPTAPVSRLERISTAVRLTRQAVDAWASLIQPSHDKVADDDQADCR